MASAVKGINEVIAEMRKFGKDAEKIIAAETEATAIDIENTAKKLAPKNFGKLAQSINHDKINPLLWSVFVNELYGAYMEFGTGAKVDVPKEFQDLAKQFQNIKGGTFEDGLESIRAWCRAKGIDEKAAYPIFAKILGAGVNPQPFLYPAWVKGKEEYLKRLTSSLNKLNRKI